eukprot:gene14118-14247_t
MRLCLPAAETDRFEFEPVVAVAALSLHYQQQKQGEVGDGGGAADLPSPGWKFQLQHQELPVARSQSSTLSNRRVSRSAAGLPTTAISLDAAARAHSFNVVRRPPAASSSSRNLHAGAAGLQHHPTSASGLSCRSRSSLESAMSTESGGGSVLAAARSGSLSTALQHLKPQEQQQRRLRLTEMCDNHAMFQFLFDPQGVLLTANKRALNNMKEHLGEQPTYTLAQYLAIGQFDGGLTADEIFQVIHTAIFINQEPSFRLPQLRWSKRRPGKCRWVLYEMWAMEDPVTGKPALLVTEQNITQGAHVSLGEVDELRVALVQSTTTNLHAPLYLDEQVLHHTQALSYEPEVGASLLQMLSVCQWERLSDDGGSVEDKVLQEIEEADESDSSSTTCAGPMPTTATTGGSDEAAGGGERCNPAGDNRATSAVDPAAGSRPAAAGGAASAVMSAGTAGGAVEGVKKRSAAVRQMITLANSPTLELEAVLSKADDWQFDTFKLAAASDNRPLSVLAFYLLKRSGLVAR